MLLLIVLLGSFPAAAFAQTMGSLQGHVYDGRTQQPLADAVVSLVGGITQARTNDSGFFHLAPLPTGGINVRIARSGYAAAIERVEVAEGSGADFKLFSSTTVLDAIMVNARTMRESSSRDGAKTTTVHPDERGRSSASAPNDLVARVPGALVLSGGQLGSGSTIQLRGLKSLTGTGNPLIYVDGARVSGGEPRRGGEVGAGANGRPGRYSTVIDQLDPATIDHIEVLPGAAATSLYGTGAADGVILIYTKR